MPSICEGQQNVLGEVEQLHGAVTQMVALEEDILGFSPVSEYAKNVGYCVSLRNTNLRMASDVEPDKVYR